MVGLESKQVRIFFVLIVSESNHDTPPHVNKTVYFRECKYECLRVQEMQCMGL